MNLIRRIALQSTPRKLLLACILSIFYAQNTYAFKTITYKPIVKYNSSKSHYLVSLPKNKDSRNGFTAVFDSKTHQLTFKIPRYFCDGFIFLSNDGNKLIYFDSEVDSLDKHMTLFFRVYAKDGDVKCIPFYNEKKNAHTWEGLHDICQEKNKLIVVAEDSSYILLEDNLSVSTIKNGAIGNYMSNLNNGLLDNDSVFSISNLKINGIPIIETLLAHLNMKELPQDSDAKGKATYILNFENYVSTTVRTFHGNELSLMNTHYKTEDKNETFLLKMKIIDLMDNYLNSMDVIPDGVDFWYFSDSFLIVEN